MRESRGSSRVPRRAPFGGEAWALFFGSRIGQGHTPIRPLGCVRKKQSGAAYFFAWERDDDSNSRRCVRFFFCCTYVISM